jgi:D-amino peptidase
MKRQLKICISVDIEEITGVTHWDEATKGRCDYSCFVERVTNEAVAAAMHRAQGGIRHATA